LIPQRIKNLYLQTLGTASVANLFCWRLREHFGNHLQPRFLNLGSGEKYIPGLINIDANPLLKKDLWLDVRWGLPFRDDSVQAIYICHTLEHFDFRTAQKILRECGRVLVDGGGLRIVVPSLDKAIAAYNRGDVDWFAPWPDNYTSLGGRFNNFLLCRDQHRLMFDFSLAKELLESLGFCQARQRPYGASDLFPSASLMQMEPERDRDYHERSLIVEAGKPRRSAAQL
jgi:predicted SAM-dependent methyltransferase